MKKYVTTKYSEFLTEKYNKNTNLNHEWTHDIVEKLSGYYNIRNYKKVYNLIKEIVDKAIEVESFQSFSEFIWFHTDYFETNIKNDNLKNLWWPKLEYLLGESESINRDFEDESFMEMVISIMNAAIDDRKKSED